MVLAFRLGELHRRVLRFTHGAEHYAAVAYSSAEVFELHHAIWFISLSLVIFGAGAVVYEKFNLVTEV